MSKILLMNNKLQIFISKAVANRRITFGDVRRLQRDILPNGIASRDEAERLIHLDGQITRADSAWTDWLVVSVVDFAIWVERPTGAVVGEASRWITELLSGPSPLTKAARRIAREIRLEAERVDEPLVSFGAEDDRPRDFETSAFVAPSDERAGLAA